MLQEIYKILKDCDEVKTVYEINEIINELSTIDNILNHGNITAITEVYNQMYEKYKVKLDVIGFHMYHNILEKFSLANNNINNTNYRSISSKLETLKNWIIEYGAYKVLEARGKRDLEKCTLKYYQNEIKNRDSLNNTMNYIDSRLLEQLKQ